MSTLNHLFDLPDQICYVQCGFCATILMVSVPCSILSTLVTVRCGHCTSLLSVNMKKASFVPFHLLASLTHVEQKESASEDGANKTLNSYNNTSIMTNSDCEEENMTQISNVVNKPPEKRQRTPSAYNVFIKEEIKRLKAENPKMAHKEAFSTAAKNWANFPPSQCNGEADSCNQTEQLVDLDSHEEPRDDAIQVNGSVCLDTSGKKRDQHLKVNKEGQGFRGRKVARNSILARTPFE